MNPVAGSFAERVPLLVISGGPGEEERKLGVLIHHQAKEIESQYRIYREVTCAAKIIDDPLRAATDIDEVVRAIWLHQQPGYLEIHRDMVEREIRVPKEIIEWNGELPQPQSDRRKLDEAVRETVEHLNHAKRPLILVGIESYRFKAAKDIVALVERDNDANIWKPKKVFFESADRHPPEKREDLTGSGQVARSESKWKSSAT